MIDLLTEPFATTIMQRVLIGGLVVATITALIGTWVVVRGLAFFGDALAHGVLPGIALATIWGINPLFGAMASAVVMVLGISVIHRATKLRDDTGIGLLFVGMLALGVVIVSRSDSFTGDITAFLFGDILGVRETDIVVGLAALVITAVGLMLGNRAFTALAVNPDKAAALGLRPRLAHAVMLGLLALAVVASFRVVGTLLVFGFLVAPPATAVLLARSIPNIMAVATLFGWLAVVVGLEVSYYADTAASATMAGIAVAQFFVVLAIVEVVTAIRQGRPSRRVLAA